jgi:branched-chain amino acid transport system substrate-binding protein
MGRRLTVGILTITLLFIGITIPGERAEAQPLKIGALYPLSGSLALLGEESWRGAEVARRLRNQKGGVAGKQVEFVKVDIPDVNAAKSDAERLINREGLKLLTGTYSSSLCLAASEVAARAGIIYFEQGGIADPITGRGYKTLLRTCPKAQFFSRSQLKFSKDWIAPQIGKKPGDLRLSLVHEDSAYGSSISKNVEAEAKAAGVPLVSTIPYNSQAVDLSSVILRLKGDKPDVVIGVSYANDAILLGRQARELGLDIKAFIGTGGGHSLRSFQEALGAAAEGVFNVDFTQYEVNTQFTPGLKEFVDLYKQAFGEAPRSGHSLTNFMGTHVLFDLLEKTGGNMEAGKFRQTAAAFEGKAGTTATGWGVKFDDSGQNVMADPFLTQWRGGKLVTVYPDGAAVMKPALIKPFGK